MNRPTSTIFTGLALAMLASTTTARAQTITSLPDSPVALSGRLRIQGSGFGSAGTVTINGVPALTTVWRSDEVHAYVPESTNLGSAQVQVATNLGTTSNVVPVDVVPRQADGRVRWRFAISSIRPNGQGPAIGPDGTLYVDDSDGRLYALTPDGELLWIFDGNAGASGVGLEGPIDVAEDGTIYYATNPLGAEIRVHAVNPDGTSKWTYSEFSVSYRIIAGPNVGPDGNLYLVFDRAHLGTKGACSLDPNGNLRWSNPGSPAVNDTGSLGHRIAFGPNVFYVAFNEGQVPGANDNYVFGFGFDGVQQFAVPNAWQTGRPHARPDGSFILRWGLDTTLRSMDAAGNEQWTFSAPSNLTEPVVGPDGVAYHQVGGGPSLHAIGPDGAIQWTVSGPQLGWMNFMGVSPLGGHLLDGGRAGLGQPGWIRDYSTTNGDLNWSIDLPEEDPGSGLADLVVQSDWAFSSDSSKGHVMVNALVWDSQDGYAYLYAVDLEEPTPGSNYCSSNANSTGNPAEIHATGTDSVISNDLTLVADGLPSNTFGIFLVGPNQGFVMNPNGSLGNLCLVGSIGRYMGPGQILNTGAGHSFSLAIDNQAIPQPIGFASTTAGDTWNFQAWFRDVSPTGPVSNFTNGLEVVFQD